MANEALEKLKNIDFKALLEPEALKERMLGLFLGPRDLLGVDIGTYAVKLVHLAGGKEPKLKAWGVYAFDLPPEAEDELRRERLVQLIEQFIKEKKVLRKEVATSVSGNAVIVRYVTLPKIAKSDLPEMLPAEAEPFIPFDIAEVALGCHIVQEVSEEGEAKMETVLVAVKNEVVEERVDILQDCGLLPVVIDVDAFALEGLHERLAPKDEEGAVLYLNVGHSVTNLSIIEGGLTRVVRDIFISGSTFSKAVMKSLGCDPQKAEEAKHTKGVLLTAEEKENALSSDDRDGLGVSVAVSSVLKDLVVEIQRSVEFYLSQNPERQVSRVVLCGGSVMIHNLPEFLSKQLSVPVAPADPFAFVKGAEGVPVEVRPQLAVATGLALRKMGDWL